MHTETCTFLDFPPEVLYEAVARPWQSAVKVAKSEQRRRLERRYGRDMVRARLSSTLDPTVLVHRSGGCQVSLRTCRAVHKPCCCWVE